jgi:hypothetical protein
MRKITLSPRLRKILLGLLYIAATIAFIFVLGGIVDWLHLRADMLWRRQFFPPFHLIILRDIILTLSISILFTFRHFCKLFSRKSGQKLVIKPVKLIVAAILILIAHIPIIGFYHEGFFEWLPARLWQPLLGVRLMPVRLIMLFIFWYNLFYAFDKKRHEGECNASDTEC